MKGDKWSTIFHQAGALIPVTVNEKGLPCRADIILEGTGEDFEDAGEDGGREGVVVDGTIKIYSS